MPTEETTRKDAHRGTMQHPVVQDLFLNPTKWEIWPAVAVLRWVQRQMRREHMNVSFRARARLAFAPSEIDDISFRTPSEIEMVINALGVASTGSALPSADIARMIAGQREGGAATTWLDMVTDRLMHAGEASMRRTGEAFSGAIGTAGEASRTLRALVGRDGVLSQGPGGPLHAGQGRGARRLEALSAPFALRAPSAHGLARTVEAYTGLDTKVRENTGATLEVAHPARIGGRVRRVLGARRACARAGVTVRIDATRAGASGIEWASDDTRVESVYELARSYIGDSTPIPALEVALASETVECARPGDARAVLGRSAVLQRGPGRRMVLRVRSRR